MDVKEFYYELPEELIAQEPLEKRDTSRLMVVKRDTRIFEHRIFEDITEYLEEGDCLVLNDTRVIPARLLGVKKDTGGRMEFVLLKRIKGNTWEVLVKPGRRARIGSVFVFGDGRLLAKVLDYTDAGGRIVEFYYDGIFEKVLDELGRMPVPPYIKKELKDRERYQTVYARNPGSAAAPTAGLHFTEELLRKIEQTGVKICYITLHVGLGTFRPVKVRNVEQHKMHHEYFEVGSHAAETINRAKEGGKRVIAVGTTSTRTLETVADEKGFVKSVSGWTDLFIYPGYRFKVVDGMVTNFHLPESTLLMLVCAFADRDLIMAAYREAIDKRYRFYSFGDAMLII
ncbi:tRNA preQ1(34) S-adenosylmethionine ribosyltransferase-isomerase QueA [Thermosediminibacter litoriperuensis]|uniref:tRNA preQ1(34) S-adenosylmethionine ribosyltransferase-isomerase QueA n=1 Tax=Thermosediminibacter litoriperuensis TaxID=291989 RepID=UPI0011E7B0EA|nr:tRNA preQ1(34) S-adenosylmethionine ribosyltransferase-isomerase QueA [Thermosediminibacter litoriperuensis]